MQIPIQSNPIYGKQNVSLQNEIKVVNLHKINIHGIMAKIPSIEVHI